MGIKIIVGEPLPQTNVRVFETSGDDTTMVTLFSFPELVDALKFVHTQKHGQRKVCANDIPDDIWLPCFHVEVMNDA